MNPYLVTPTTTLYLGDALEVLRQIPDCSVQTCVTSPPYFGLRDYGIEGQLGLETTPEAYVCGLVAICRELRRVLREDGTFWLNLGDSYAGSGKGRNADGHHSTDTKWKQATNRGAVVGIINALKETPGLKDKDLMGIPWRVAFALQADGWYLRSDIIWSKRNPMPESVEDRPTKAHEYLFLLAKSPRYYYDAEAIKEPSINRDSGNKERQYRGSRGAEGLSNEHVGFGFPYSADGAGRNKRTVWEISTTPYPGAHFATFPPDLVEPCILAGTSEQGCCAKCGAPQQRIVEKAFADHGGETDSQYERGSTAGRLARMRQASRAQGQEYANTTKTIGWRPTCECGAPTKPCVVLDIFTGSGTTNEVAGRLGRQSIGIDLNPKYLDLAVKRIAGVPLPLTLLDSEQKGK